jgi:hypothetical protein
MPSFMQKIGQLLVIDTGGFQNTTGQVASVVAPSVIGGIYGSDFGPEGTLAGIGIGLLFQLGEALYDSATKPAIPNTPTGLENVELNFQSGFHP